MGNKWIIWTCLLSNIKRKYMFHHLLVHQHQGTNVCIIVKVLRTWHVELHIRKGINHKRDTKTLECSKCRRSYTRCVMMTSFLASSMARKNILYQCVIRTCRVMFKRAIDPVSISRSTRQGCTKRSYFCYWQRKKPFVWSQQSPRARGFTIYCH